MSKRSLIVIIVVAVIAAVSVGRFAFMHTTSSRQDEAAKSASRAMTFTQPKAPAQ